MEFFTYTSFKQINEELEILKLENEVNYQKMILTFQKTKGNIQPNYVKGEIALYIKERLSDSYRSLLVVAIPYILKLLKRKRGY